MYLTEGGEIMADKREIQNGREEAMRSGSLPLTITKMALPCIISFLITSIYNLADTYFVSALGTEATAAVSVNASLDQLIMMMGSFIAIGSASLISRLLGAGERKKADQILTNGFIFSLALGLLLTVAGTLFRHQMVRLLGATDTCEQFSVDYATYVLLAAPFMASSFVMNQCLRAEGNALLSMVGMGFGGILNCFLDPIFIFNMGLGVAGASMATSISKLISFCILLFPYITRRSTLHLSVRNFKPEKDSMIQVVSMGSSALFRTGLAIVAAIVLNKLAGQISDSVLASVGVSTKIMMFPFGFILGFGQGFQPVTGYNWGAKQYDRVLESYRFASRASLIGSAVMALLIGLGANRLILLFTENDAQMMKIGALCIRLQCIALPAHAWVTIVNMLCVSIGKPKGAVALSTSRQGSCFLPIVYPMARLFGEYGIASVQAVADVLSLVLAIPIMRKMLRYINDTAAAGKAVPDA